MLFPERKRVIYGKKPSEEVICQLRFPTILRIASEPPALFQERIRQQYPLLRQMKPNQLPLPEEFLKSLGPGFSLSMANPAYDFISADEKWTISLTSDF